ncbi:MAG: OmpA family protein [Candidatus Polarisedimenticolia bacterium]
MAFSILESLNQFVTPGAISQASSYLGESDQTVKKGFSAAIPAVLGSVATRADDPAFIGQVYGLASDPDNDPGLLSNLGSMLSPGAGAPGGSLGTRFTALLFGGQRGTLERTLSGYAGLKPSSAASMLGMVAPMVLAFLGKTARQTGTGATGLASMLMDQKSSIMAALPSGFARVLPGYREPVVEPARPFVRSEEAHREPAHRATTYQAAHRTASPMRWIIPGILVLAGLWAITSLFRGREHAPEAPRTAANLPYDTTGLDNRLTSDIRAGEGNWHDLDQVTFKPGSADTTPQSRDALASVAAILKANPDAHIALTGYSADARDDSGNLELSKRRAEQVKQVLVDFGVPGNQIKVEMSDPSTGMSDVMQVGSGRENGVALRVVKR